MLRLPSAGWGVNKQKEAKRIADALKAAGYTKARWHVSGYGAKNFRMEPQHYDGFTIKFFPPTADQPPRFAVKHRTRHSTQKSCMPLHKRIQQSRAEQEFCQKYAAALRDAGWKAMALRPVYSERPFVLVFLSDK